MDILAHQGAWHRRCVVKLGIRAMWLTEQIGMNYEP